MSKNVLLSGTGDMKKDWDLRAAQNARYYVDIMNYKTEKVYLDAGRAILFNCLFGVSVAPGWTLLDLGCGTGRVIYWASAFFSKVIGVDVSPLMLEKARGLCAPLVNVVLIENDGYILESVDDESVDLAISYATLQHVPKEVFRGYMNEVARILRPGALFRFQLYIPDDMNEPPDTDTWLCRPYTSDEVRDVIGAAGFEVVTLLQPLPHVLWSTPLDERSMWTTLRKGR